MECTLPDGLFLLWLYVSREACGGLHQEKLDQNYPFDVFRATLTPSAEQEPQIIVDLNMYTGKIVAFSKAAKVTSEEGQASLPLVQKRTRELTSL